MCYRSNMGWSLRERLENKKENLQEYEKVIQEQIAAIERELKKIREAQPEAMTA